MSAHPTPPPPPLEPARRVPAWATELLDILRLRRGALLAVAVVASLAGVLTTLVRPELLPPRPLAGAAVGLAAVLVGIAAAVAVDAGDRRVQGPRHVRATGAAVAAVTRVTPSRALTRWVDARLREHPGLRLAVAGTGVDGTRSGELTDALGSSLARQGWRVLIADLSGSGDGGPGAAEVCRGERRLADVVRFHPTLDLARLGPGDGLDESLTGFPALAARLPRDVDVLLVGLPGLRHAGALVAAAAVDRVLLLAVRDATTRVELTASLDGLDEAGIGADVALVIDDVPSEPAPRREERPGPGPAVPQPDPEPIFEDRPASPAPQVAEPPPVSDLPATGPPSAEAAFVPDEPPVPMPEPEPVEPEVQPAPVDQVEPPVDATVEPPVDATVDPPVEPPPGSAADDTLDLGQPDRWEEAPAQLRLVDAPRVPAQGPDEDADLRSAVTLDALAHELWAREDSDEAS